MTKEQSILLDLLSKVLFDRPISHNFDVCDWKAVYEESKKQAVTSLYYHALDDHLAILSEIDQTWRKDSLRSISGNMVVTHNHVLLHEWVTEADIPYVISKGVASARYYPAPEYRAMGDVDFLVPKDQVDKAGKILKEHGLTSSETGHLLIKSFIIIGLLPCTVRFFFLWDGSTSRRDESSGALPGNRKKINVKHMYDKAADRIDVYRKLHLLEVDTPDRK